MYKKKILFVEPYYTGSHKQWIEGYTKHSFHECETVSMPGRFWKWRMHGGAITLCEELADKRCDIVVASDMLDLALFKALLPAKYRDISFVLYFHENQITYPWSPKDRDRSKGRDVHYGFINYTSALAADYILFNSDYHRTTLLNALPAFLKQFPDYTTAHKVDELWHKSKTLHLGLDLKRLEAENKKKHTKPPSLLWNHRREHDKNPEGFLSLLHKLEEKSFEYQLILLGESFAQEHPVFTEISETFKHRIFHNGYADSFAEYKELLSLGDILPVTSRQDFFGISVLEAAYAGVVPLLPKRLAYPEIYTDFQSLFYESEDELAEKIVSLAASDNLSVKGALKEMAEGYDWSVKAGEYDEYFAGL